MGGLQNLFLEHDLIHIEDTCESLGSTHNGQFLGSFADMGCYSFYYSHHLTTGEGGMVTCKSQDDADLLRCLRAHGWTRNLSNRQEIESRHSEIDSRFLLSILDLIFDPRISLQQLESFSSKNEHDERQSHQKL
ncbi:MAG: DegT/DnrJ/EryC1/StrS family aminotransferase [Bdellovibrionales bacterium]|nr:DegT/DnrJ/EryC1/StrS family aminotransferase [Bdellovibrionales bacterium]